MIASLERPRPAAARLAFRARPFELVGSALLRYGLVFFLVGIGLMKFTEFEALAIQPFVANSPFMSWLYGATSVRGAAAIIGVVEVTIGVLLAIRHWWPRLSAIGSLGAIVTFLTTLSFLFTTPGLSPDASGFLMKDLMLLAAAVWTAGDALRAAEAR